MIINCGSCRHFIKWKKSGRGLCMYKDASTKSDYGHKCPYWKGIKYNRIKYQIRFNYEMKLLNEHNEE